MKCQSGRSDFHGDDNNKIHSYVSTSEQSNQIAYLNFGHFFMHQQNLNAIDYNVDLIQTHLKLDALLCT